MQGARSARGRPANILTPRSLPIGAVALNAMVKEWDAIGLHLWAEEEGYLFPEPRKISYLAGPRSTDHLTAHARRSQLVAALPIGATSAVLSIPAGVHAGEHIGFFLDAGFFFWTTVDEVQQSDDLFAVSDLFSDPDLFNGQRIVALTFKDPLPFTAGQNNVVYTYLTPLPRPLRILDARRVDTITLIETPLIQMSRLDFRDLPNKFIPGSLNAWFYDPQLDDGVIWIWQQLFDSRFIMKFTWMRQLEDFNAARDTPDFPQEWTNCLTWNLADQMLVEYNTPEPAGRISQRAAASLDRVTGFDKEPESIYAGVNFDQSTR